MLGGNRFGAQRKPERDPATVLRPKPLASAAEHRAITGAIRRGNPDAAEAAARAHRTRARDALPPLLAHYGMRNL